MNATTLATRAAPRHPPDQRDSAPRWVGSDQRGWAVHSSGSRLAARIVPRLFHHAPSVPCVAQRVERDREAEPLVDLGPAEPGCPQAQHLDLLRLSPAVLTRPHPARSTMRRIERRRCSNPVLRPHISPALFFQFDNVRNAGRNNPCLGNQRDLLLLLLGLVG